MIMKRIFCFALMALFTTNSLVAQEIADDDASPQSQSDEIWGKKQKNTNDNSSVLKWRPPPPSTAAPIDGGVLLLLGAGVLYGRKRLTKKTA
ncbi:MAG: hypothetical protein JWR72_704 [Flavisolibacter sp.]|jgi:hypothetical protein|nr:hypothetical protein [Flavisolibacter sp.]